MSQTTGSLLSSIKIGNQIYSIKDSSARSSILELFELTGENNQAIAEHINDANERITVLENMLGYIQTAYVYYSIENLYTDYDNAITN